MNELLKVTILVLLILGLMLSGSCARTSEAPGIPGEGGGDESSVSDEVARDRKIVKTGSMTLEVEDIAETMDEVAEMADELNGYVVSSYK
ncbi:unnamed protein product, partial [marine sediment metagenome]